MKLAKRKHQTAKLTEQELREIRRSNIQHTPPSREFYAFMRGMEAVIEDTWSQEGFISLVENHGRETSIEGQEESITTYKQGGAKLFFDTEEGEKTAEDK